MIEARFPFDKTVLAEAYNMHRSLRRWTKWLRFFSWLGFAFGMWLVVKEHRSLEGGITAGIATLFIIWPYLGRALWLRVISDHPFFGQEVSCQFDTKGFAMSASSQRFKLAWEDAFKIVQGATGYLIYPKNGVFYYVPARGFATTIDAERVKGFFLSEKMRRT